MANTGSACDRTPAYMAPEQLHANGGSGYLGTAVDVWASGIMLLVMLVRGCSCQQGTTCVVAVLLQLVHLHHNGSTSDFLLI